MVKHQRAGFRWSIDSRSGTPVLPALAMLLLAITAASAQQPEIPTTLQSPFDTATAYADSQRESNGVATLTGHVEITYRQARLLADKATYNRSTGEIDAEGNVAFTDPRAYFEADRAVYNVIRDTGTFFDAHGYVHATERQRSNVPTTSGALFVQARRIDRVDENTYTVSAARLTSCENECRGWSLDVHRARLTADDKAVSYGDTFRFFNAPLFYLPAAEYSVGRNPRQSGFLIPSIGTSTQKGQIIGDGFFWAINHSADLMMGVDEYTSRGVATIGRFRATPSDTSQLVLNYYGVNDKISGPLRAGGQNIRASGVSQDLFDGFRGVIDMDYINSLAFRLTWSNNFNEAVSSEARQTGFLSKSFDDYNLNFYAERYEDFLCAQETATSGTSACNTSQALEDHIIIRHTPSVSFSGADHEIGDSPVYFDFAASADGLGRDEPGLSTPLVTDRLDFHPEISLRVPEFGGFHFTPAVGMEATHYGTSLLGAHDPVNRVLGDVSFDLRPPSFERIFDRRIRHYRLKHVIEPDIKYHLVRAENDTQILDVVRFDQTDILAETNEIEYSLKTSLYGRPDGPDDQSNPPQARELVSLSLTQKYYFDGTFGGVLQPGQNVWAPTIDLTGFAFARGQHVSPVVTVLKAAPFSNYDTELRADFDPSGGGVLNAGITSGVHHGDVAFEATDFFVSRTAELGFVAPILPAVPASSLPSSNLFNARVIYGQPERRGFSGALGVNYNITEGLANEVVAQGTYNFSCFGVDIGFNRFNLGPLRKENQFRIAISLSNVGAFGNLKGRDRLYQQDSMLSNQ